MWGIMMRAKMGWWFKHRCQWGEGLEGGSLFKQPLRCAEKLTHFYPDPPLFVSIYCAVTFERLSLNRTRSAKQMWWKKNNFYQSSNLLQITLFTLFILFTLFTLFTLLTLAFALQCPAHSHVSSIDVRAAQLGERMLQCRWVFCFTVVTLYILTLL